ncbi:5421_t:CDS:2 [Diversispora eburnea]|uniref:5421_t:CDS:1 n=1 Tax=Diversispora eburnea TaxID=1213867 RepID=A0A9N8WFM5_9GLOM|nr:5421_t:CDS:2 [Diversispora eburnea]
MYPRKNNKNAQRKKVTNACKNCRKRKSKCSGREISGSNSIKQCDRCLRHNLKCEFIEPSIKRGPPKGRDRYLIYQERECLEFPRIYDCLNFNNVNFDVDTLVSVFNKTHPGMSYCNNNCDESYVYHYQPPTSSTIQTEFSLNESIEVPTMSFNEARRIMKTVEVKSIWIMNSNRIMCIR